MDRLGEIRVKRVTNGWTYQYVYWNEKGEERSGKLDILFDSADQVNEYNCRIIFVPDIIKCDYQIRISKSQ